MNKLYIVLIAGVLAAGAWLWFGPQATVAPEQANAPDETASINGELDGIRVDDPDFGSVDADLGSL